ncbi:MAG TPA: energy transducer TonB [Acidobacteriaceae bacterium]|jgi:TonB family protein|nr:energy transducer TonB [Acidobacteriaceae bacterium]
MLRRILQVFLLSVLSAGPAFSQASSTPVPPPKSGTHYPLPRARVRAAILSDIGSADRQLLNQAWLLSVRQKLLMSWRPLIPDTDRRPMVEAGSAVLLIRLGPKGLVRHVRVERSARNQARNPALVTAAEGAVKAASPYPPFPPGVKARGIRLRVTFLYD